MKTNVLKFLAIIFSATVLFAACSSGDDDDNDDDTDNTPTTIQANNEWEEGTIKAGETIWYKVVGEATFTTMYVEWAETGEDNHGENKDYTADIKVSAYKLDGETAYFENKNSGYKDNIKTVALDNETEILVKVQLNDESLPGTFAIRSTGTGVVNLEYIEVTTLDEWIVDVINEGEIKGYKFKHDFTEETIIDVIWAESDSPEEGYDAGISGSVFYKDGETPYKTVDKGDDFLDKNKSHSDNPKAIQVDLSENNFKVHIKETDSDGDFAIKFVIREQ